MGRRIINTSMAKTRPAIGAWLPILQRYQGLVGLLLLLSVAFLLVRNTFFTAANASNILDQLAVSGSSVWA
jgi:hypothetical protein